MARAIGEVGGEVANIRAVRLTGNVSNNEVPWVRQRGAVTADVTADHNHGPSAATSPPPDDIHQPVPITVGAMAP